MDGETSCTIKKGGLRMTTHARKRKPMKQYKDRMFRLVFDDRKKLLELYNAVSGKHYEDPELLTINTLENAIYMSMRNDLSFLIDSRLSLYEHQSTYNPNLPLRFLFYLSDLYSAMVHETRLYGSSQIEIPAPRFVVFYNGTAKRPDRETICLSDMYTVKEADISMELKAEVLNINAGHNRELMESCRTLWEYAEYVERVRMYAKEMTIEEAVEQAIGECIEENILKEFLEKNRAEAKTVSIYEYNEEEHIRMEREEAFENGRKAGIEQEQARTKLEKDRADVEKDRADQAVSRVKNMEEEIQRLREELEKYKKA